jgi:hypothetical protein
MLPFFFSLSQVVDIYLISLLLLVGILTKLFVLLHLTDMFLSWKGYQDVMQGKLFFCSMGFWILQWGKFHGLVLR